MNPFFLILKTSQLFMSALSIVVGIVFYGADSKRKVNRFFCFTFVSGGMLTGSLACSELAAFFWHKRFIWLYWVEIVSGSLTPTFFLHAFLEFTGHSFKNRRTLLSLYAISLLISVCFYYFTVIRIIDRLLVRVYDPVLPVYGIYFTLCGLISAWLLWRKFHLTQDQIIKRQIRSIGITLLVSCTFIIFVGIVLPLFGFNYGFFIAQLGGSIGILGISYAIL